jgi:predicted O-methyltransferase YrrM
MNQNTWSSVDSYFSEMLVVEDDCLKKAIKDSEAAGLPPHNVAPNQGKLLHLLAKMQGAKTILEIGTLGGYSTIWLARALPRDGRLVTLEADPKNAAIASANLNRAGLSSIVSVRVGQAAETLRSMIAQREGPFDLIFIDADKPSNPVYLEQSIELSHIGTVIIVDNVVREGEVVNPTSDDTKVQGVRAFFEIMSADPRLSATAIQTVGIKGYDGFSLAVVNH